MPDIKVDRNRVAFYLDFSVDIQKNAQFQDLKRQLRNLRVPYAMLYPAKLLLGCKLTPTSLIHLRRQYVGLIKLKAS